MKWAIAGYGDVVVRRVLPALRALGEEPVRLWGRDPLRAARTAERFGIPSVAGAPGELLDGADALYVATPVVHHVPLTAAGLRAGLHVLVEKPLAGTLRPGGARLDGAGPGCAGAAYYRRLAPAVAAVCRQLGDWRPERVEVRFRTAFAPGPAHPMAWRTDPAVSGGGVLADAGSHRLDLLLTLFGTPATVRARLTRRFPSGAERRAEVVLEWPRGLRAHCLTEWDHQAPPVDLLTMTGGGRTLTLDPLDSGRLCVTTAHGTRRQVLPPAGNPHQPLIADFRTAATTGRPPVCPLPEAALVDAVLVAAERSDARGGGPVRVRA
ncbi:Gfo/Idh/MocA family oxidoreductase [Streptomyces sp. NPDC003036]|uniref:Gfo/Idh/MocA family protein n=1 Tax=Streptomyces sp. NPDC003036 TaxID=3154442 RepID=UPI0033B154FB